MARPLPFDHNMKKVKTPCWKDVAHCEGGEKVDVFYTISDFYEGRHLFIHPGCGAIFAVDPDTEHYQKKDFQKLKQNLLCPECGKNLNDVLPYPENFRCPSTGQIERFIRVPNDVPKNRAELVVEFWDPLT